MRPVGSDLHEWVIDIHNRYRTQARFHWVLAASGEEKPRLNNLITLRAGGRSRRNSMSVAGARERPRLLVGRLRLGENSSAEQSCDEKN